MHIAFTLLAKHLNPRHKHLFAPWWADNFSALNKCNSSVVTYLAHWNALYEFKVTAFRSPSVCCLAPQGSEMVQNRSKSMLPDAVAGGK